MGGVKDLDLFEKYEEMEKVNTQSALLAAHLASKYLGEQGFLMFTGASACFEGPTNWAFAYGMSKTVTHSIALNIARQEDIPSSSRVCTILPQILDTKANREAMPEFEDDKFTPCDQVADLIQSWANGENRPENGSFAKLNFEKGCVVPEFY